MTAEGTVVVTVPANRATDAAGNANTPSTSTDNTVAYDATAPSATVATPADTAVYNGTNFTQFSGTSSDGGGLGVSAVAVSVRNIDFNQCWSGTAFNVACPNYVPVSGTTNWTHSIALSSLEGHYSITARATDTVGNQGFSAVSTFRVDKTNPLALFTFPTSNSSYNATNWNAGAPVRGTAQEVIFFGSGVNNVKVSVRQGSGDYWDGSSFSSVTEVFVNANRHDQLELPVRGGQPPCRR